MLKYLGFLLTFLPLLTKAQSFDLGSWNILNLKLNVDSKWSLFAETQLRSLKFYHHFHYYEYKGGVNYVLHKGVTVWLGAGSYQTYKEGGNFVLPKNNDEFRIWPQLILVQSVGSFKIEQRYRMEFRFTSQGYRNRYRYRAGVSFPFGKKTENARKFQISASNELFFTVREPYFESNRLLFALSYRLSAASLFQIGYLHQFDYKINDETGRDFLQCGLYVELFKK